MSAWGPPGTSGTHAPRDTLMCTDPKTDSRCGWRSVLASMTYEPAHTLVAFLVGRVLFSQTDESIKLVSPVTIVGEGSRKCQAYKRAHAVDDRHPAQVSAARPNKRLAAHERSQYNVLQLGSPVSIRSPKIVIRLAPNRLKPPLRTVCGTSGLRALILTGGSLRIAEDRST